MKSSLIPSKDLYRFVCQLMSLQKGRFALFFLLPLVWSLDTTIWPYLLRLVIDTFTQFDADRIAAWPVLKGLCMLAVALWVVVECGFRGKNFVQAKAFPQLEADIRMTMFDHIQRHSPKYFNEHFSGSLANKISDMTKEVTSLLLNLSIFIPTLVACALSIGFFYFVSPLFALILTLWVLFQFGICLAFTPKCIAYSNVHGEVRSSLAGKIVDSLTNHFAVNLFFRFQFERARIAEAQKSEQHANYRAQFYVALMFLVFSAIFVVGGISLNGFMVFYWFQDKITTGEAIQIFTTMWNVIFVIWYSCDLIPQFFKSIGIANQALSVMQDPQDICDPSHAKPLVVHQGEIIFENLYFRYGDKHLFENKNVHIKGGERVGIVGYSGAGKSSFVNLILRMYSPQKGRILIDGQDLSQITLESLRTQVALIPQDPHLFHRTLEENIKYGRVEATRAEVMQAARLAHCDEFIQRISGGYDALVGERGAKLSGGERQRIAIARVMLAAPPILILDEATSALDSVTEQYIQESLEALMDRRTTIVIAHRLSTLAKMDRILVLDQGKIIEEGSHRELLAKEGHYAHLWKMQAGGFLPDRPT